jgi:hypothetical protein
MSELLQENSLLAHAKTELMDDLQHLSNAAFRNHTIIEDQEREIFRLQHDLAAEVACSTELEARLAER